MLVIIDKYPLESSLFWRCIINERLNLVYFIHKPKGMEGELQLPLVFESGREAREAHKRILQGRNTVASSVNISDFDCSWPMNTAQKIEQYAQHMYDFDRPIGM